MTEKPLPNTVFGQGWAGFTADWFTHRIPAWRKHILPEVSGRVIRWLEIGSHEGRSATWVMDNVLKQPGSSITCIDPWQNTQALARFRANVFAAHDELRKRGLPAGTPEVIAKRGFSQDILATLQKESFDVVYVDGDHQAKSALTDAVLSWPLLKPGGFLIFDDYKWDYKTPEDKAKLRPAREGIDAFLSFWEREFILVHHDYQVILRKTA